MGVAGSGDWEVGAYSTPQAGTGEGGFGKPEPGDEESGGERAVGVVESKGPELAEIVAIHEVDDIVHDLYELQI